MQSMTHIYAGKPGPSSSGLWLPHNFRRSPRVGYLAATDPATGAGWVISGRAIPSDDPVFYVDWYSHRRNDRHRSGNSNCNKFRGITGLITYWMARWVFKK